MLLSYLLLYTQLIHLLYCVHLLQASRLFECQAKSRDETALLIILASETEVELDEVGILYSDGGIN